MYFSGKALLHYGTRTETCISAKILCQSEKNLTFISQHFFQPWFVDSTLSHSVSLDGDPTAEHGSEQEQL